MKTRIFYSLFAISLVLMTGFSYSGSVRADDTDIYVNPNSASGSEPMVMFALDLRANLTSTICNSFSSGDSDATIAANCGWDTTFVSYLTTTDKSDGVIDLFELLRASLKWAMDGLDGIKVGIMLPHANTCGSAGPSAGTCSNGGYILYGFHSITADATGDANKALFFDKLAKLPAIQGTVAEPYQPAEMYFEFFRYLTGQGIYNAHLGWNDLGYSGSPTVNLDGYDNSSPTPLLVKQTPDNSYVAWDTGIEDSTHTKYITPLDTSMTCAKIFVVNVAFGVTNSDGDSNSAISDTKNNGGMDNLNLSGLGKNANFGAVLNWMYKNDIADGTYGTAPDVTGTQNVTSFFLTDKVNTTTNAWAAAGGTGNATELGSDPSALRDKLKNIFSQILSVSTTFVSASVPVNVFNRADYLDDVYLALFEAEENANPHWIGNLKKLKLQQDATGAWYIGDVNGNPAFGADGRINYNALTYWTDPNGTDVQTADPKKNEIAGYDGRSINRGGAGQQINGFLSGSPGLANSDSGARQIFTEPASYTNGSATALMALDATATNASSLWPDLNALGVYASGSVYNSYAWSTYSTYTDAANAGSPDTTEALNILKWARGIDVKDEDGDTDTTDVRPWLMSDPIHSRPLTINYGITGSGYSESNPDVRIVIAGNDGFLHMVQNTDSSGAESGKENWAFIPRYSLRILDRLMNNVSYSKILHPYGVDGTPVLYTHDANGDGNIIKGSCSPTDTTDCDKAYMYFGMRRGGRNYYAMDITDPNNPKILWSISNTDANFSELGLTFSNPKVAQISYDTNKNVPVLVFGGGYDTNKDTRSNSLGSSDSMGNAVYIVDALNGSLIWKATGCASSCTTGSVSSTKFQNSQMQDSIPSEVTALDSDGDGNIDRIYVGDTGGQVWRLDVAGTDRSQWKSRVLASVGRHALSNKTNDRRFFHALDVVQTLDANGPYDAVIGGTGDRANPLDIGVGNNVPENWFYMFKDRDTVSGPSTYKTPLYTQGSMTDVSSDCLDTNNCSTAPDLTNGWMFKLAQATGEKDLSRPITIFGVIYFTTYLPPVSSTSGSCEPSEGKGSQYAVNLQDATAAFNWDQTNTTNGTGTVNEMGATDRYMSAGIGIPADVIAIRKSGEIQTLAPGDNYAHKRGKNNGTKTFWYTDGE